MKKKKGPYRDGKIHVLKERCDTCIFRPGNLMHLSAEGLRTVIKGNRDADSALTCHQTLPSNGRYIAEPALCRGYYDGYADVTTPLILAKAMGVIEEDEMPRMRNLDDLNTVDKEGHERERA